jgi:hypothetical protein
MRGNNQADPATFLRKMRAAVAQDTTDIQRLWNASPDWPAIVTPDGSTGRPPVVCAVCPELPNTLYCDYLRYDDPGNRGGVSSDGLDYPIRFSPFKMHKYYTRNVLGRVDLIWWSSPCMTLKKGVKYFKRADLTVRLHLYCFPTLGYPVLGSPLSSQNFRIIMMVH